jgi:hypothetical protein
MMKFLTKILFIYTFVSVLFFTNTTISNAQTRASYIFTASATATSLTATLKGVPPLSTDLSDISIFIQDTPFALPNKPSISNNLLFNPKKETVAKDIVWSANIGSRTEYIRNGGKYYIRAEGAGYFSEPIVLNIPIAYEKLSFGQPSSDCKSFSITSKLNNALPTDFEVKLKYATNIDAPEFKEAEPLNGTGANMNKGIAEDGSYIYKLEGLSTATQYFVYQTIKSNKTGETINTPKENFNSCAGYIAAGTTAASDRYNQRSYRLLSDLSGKSIIPDYDLCIEEVAAKKRPEGSCNNQIGDYLNIMIKVLIGASAAWLVLQIVMKGYQYMVTDTPFKKTAAKERILESFGGLLLALSAYLILNTINPQLVTGTLNVGNIDVGVEEVYDRANDSIFMSRLNSVSTAGITGNINDDAFIGYLAHQQGASGAKAILKAAKNGTQVSEKISINMNGNFNRADAQKTIGTQILTPTNFLNYWAIRVAAFGKNPSANIPVDINTALTQVSQETGVPLTTLQVMCRIESSCDGKKAIEVVNSLGYAGLFQLSNSIHMKKKTPGVWEEFKKPNGVLLDAYHNSYVGAQFLKSNLITVRK